MPTYLGLVELAEELVVLLFLVQRPGQRAPRSERQRRSQIAGVDLTVTAVNIAALAGIRITHVSFIHHVGLWDCYGRDSLYTTAV